MIDSDKLSTTTNHSTTARPGSSTRADHSSRAWQMALVGVLVGAFALRLYQLGMASLWYDETVSAWLATQPVPELIARTARDIHPPLYYLLLRGWQLTTGPTEWSLGLFSVWWSLLLVASSYKAASWMAGRPTGLLAAGLVALSPFNVWYAQEVRMYTLGATLGLWSLMALWQLLVPGRMKKRWMSLWLLSVVAGLYALYYLAFLFVAEALIVVAALWRQWVPRDHARHWLALAVTALLLWLPWLPTALHQATEPPVPPWRAAVSLPTMLLESLGALALGQSIGFQSLALPLALLFVVIAVGLAVAWPRRRRAILFLGVALVLPSLVLWGSALSASPLYHVRYFFTYSPAFYILTAIAFIALARWAQQRGGILAAGLTAAILLAPLLFYSAESLQRFWHDPAYRTDDLRGGVAAVESQWRSNDLLLVNAGYTYTAFTTYMDDPIAARHRLPSFIRLPDDAVPSAEGVVLAEGGLVNGSPQLGWGLAESDFYAISVDETLASLSAVQERFSRLWHFRIYDTVTDPEGWIRRWLDDHAYLFYDEVMQGDSNGRVQGWYFPPRADERPDRETEVRFLAPDGSTPWVRLHGVSAPRGRLVGGGWVDLDLWLEGLPGLDPSVRLSAGLFDTTAAQRQWVVLDEQPLGPLLSLSEMPGVQRWPIRLRLPVGLPPGRYEVHLKFYHPEEGAFLVPQGENLAPPDRARLPYVVEVGPTPLDAPEPVVGTPLPARFGPLQFLGHAIPAGPWRPGASIPIELVWRILERPQVPLQLLLTSEAISSDSGGVTATYPMDQWQRGEVVRDVHYVTIAPNAPPGDYPLYLNVSQEASNVPWTQGLLRTGERLQLGTLTVQDRPRSFEPPPVGETLDVAFGDTILLIGVDRPPDGTPVTPGASIPLTLHWRALGQPPARYKVFMHLIGPDGNLVSQCDLEPGNGQQPTNGWVKEEYVSTPCQLPIPLDAPPGTHELRIGLYEPNLNERVPLFGTNTNTEDRYLVLGTVEVTE